MGNIGSWGAGATPSRNNKEYYQNGTIPWLKTGDLSDGDIYSIPEHITEKALRETSVQLNPVGSILIAMYGATIGKVGVLQIPATTNQACCACSVFNGINNRYLFFFLLSQKENFKILGGGGAQPNISKDKIINYLFPLPPSKEQQRIVEQIETLLGYVDIIDTDAETLEKSITLAKQKILDLAIRGKLVPQDPADEPASELLKKIKAEKDALVKAGKLKKDKHESYIFKGDDNCYHENIDGKVTDITEEIPFDLPEGWCFSRIGQCINLVNGRAYRQNELLSQGRYKVLRVGNFFTNSSWYYSDLDLEPEKYCYNGDLLYAWSASFGPQIWQGEKTIFHYHIWNVKFPETLFDKNFLFYFFLYDKEKLHGSTTGSTMVHISMEHMNPRFVPIPPLAEQKRIVSQVEKLFSVLETMRR